MPIRVWEQKREKLASYRPRRVESTPLYRVVYQERNNLEWHWESQFQSRYGVLREEVLKALDAYLDCGILAHGCARAECENQKCRHSIVIPYSCKKRGICPSCSAKRALIFAEHLHSEVLEKVPHRHVVLSLPKRLRPFMKYDRSLNDILLKAAWESLKEMFHAALPQGVPGAVLTVQTAGESLNLNSHIHGICSDGVFDKQGNFHPLSSLNMEKLATLFCHKVLKALQGRGLIADGVVAQILSQKHTGFSAWWGEQLPPGDEGYRLFLARYIDRGPIVNSRIEIDGDVITYHTDKDQLTHEFLPLEFLARITPHIPNKWESTVRYYAHYSHRARGARRKKAASLSTPVILPLPDDQHRKASRAWAALIKRVFEVEPLLCPKCGGRMKIKSLITDPHEVKRLLDNLGIPPFIKPQPISAVGPPQWDLSESDPPLAA
jgi:hypothetical protein